MRLLVLLGRVLGLHWGWLVSVLRHSWNDVVDDVYVLIVIVVVIRLSIWIADNV